jgi:hypothetical protein
MGAMATMTAILISHIKDKTENDTLPIGFRAAIRLLLDHTGYPGYPKPPLKLPEQSPSCIANISSKRGMSDRHEISSLSMPQLCI